jgi:hypothetical protein
MGVNKIFFIIVSDLIGISTKLLLGVEVLKTYWVKGTSNKICHWTTHIYFNMYILILIIYEFI